MQGRKAFARNGQADQTSEAMRRESNAARLAWLATLLGSTALVSAPGTAWAQCVNTGGANYLCSGEQTAGQTIAANNASVTTASDFEVDTSDQIALRIRGNGALTYQDLSSSTLAGRAFGLTVNAEGDDGATPGSVGVTTNGSITGGVYGISVGNRGSGATRLDAIGSVVGAAQIGIYAGNWIYATDLSVQTAGVQGGQDGVVVNNDGVGATQILTTGFVRGREEAGIRARNGSTATDLTIRSSFVAGGQYGIHTHNEGTGATRIIVGASNGTISGGTAEGVYAFNAATATDLAIDVVGVVGGRNGIYAENNGKGSTRITATSLVMGGEDVVAGVDGAGIKVINGSTATDLTIEAAAVLGGGGGGIVASNRGLGASHITAAGGVRSTGGHGIFLSNGANATDLTVEATSVTGADAGIWVVNSGTGATRVSAAGHVVGASLSGIAAFSSPLTTNLTIEAASVSGGTHGIVAQSNGAGFTRVSATGDVEGALGDGIRIVTGSKSTKLTIDAVGVKGGENGVFALNAGEGPVRIVATGHVEGTADTGIAAENAVTASDLTIEAASVTGGRTGLLATNRGVGATRIAATGPVEGTSDIGISVVNEASAGDLTVEAASVTGGMIGVSAINGGVGATRIVAAGPVIGTGGVGIVATNLETATDLTIEAAGVTGGQTGVAATNKGIGSTRVVATGPVEGAANIGIYVGNEATAGDLMIAATSVTGGLTGVSAINEGSGATRIIATGHVIGAGDAGISAANHTTATDLTIEAVSASGGRNGVSAQNFGRGHTHVVTTGHIEGAASSGIRAINFPGAMGLTVEAASATGGVYGVAAGNSGTGATRVIATGHVEGVEEAGILAQNFAAATDLTVQAASAKGGLYGVYALNGGAGVTQVAATGHVEGGARVGMLVENDVAGTGVIVDAVSVRGGQTGIQVVNKGTGLTRIIAAGHVEGADGDGVRGANGSTATDLSIATASVTGRRTGVSAVNDGTGFTGITTTGDVVGLSDAGIFAFNGAAATGLSIDAEGAQGAIYGVRALNYGVGDTSITTNGLVEGAVAISAHTAGQAIFIETNGLVRAASRRSADLAVEGGGGPVVFTNNGGLLGTVQFGAAANVMTNNAGWNTAGGVNDFGGGRLSNAAGVVITAAENGGVAETTLFNALGGFANHGRLVMADGGAGDITRQAGGDARFEAGSVLAVDIDGFGRSDRFISSGTATLAGATLAVASTGAMPAYGTRYTVLTAEAGLVGEFAAITGLPADTAFLTVEDRYDANNVYLDVVKYRTFASAALTPNQIATAGGLDSMGPGPVVNAVAALATDAQARGAFDQLSGEIHASAKTAMIEDSRFIRNAVNDRLRTAFGDEGAADRGGAWGQAFGSWGRWNSDGDAGRLNRSIGGFFVGADAPVSDAWRLGAAAGYSHTSFHVRDRASSGSSDNYHLGLYGGATWGELAFRAGASYTWHDITTGRSVSFPGFDDGLKAGYDAGAAQVFGELAHGIRAGDARFETFANLAYVNLRTDGFGERGGAAALAGASSKTEATFTTLGLRTSTAFNLGRARLGAKGMLGWRHAFGDGTPLSAFRFGGGEGFSTAGAPIARDAAVVEAGLDYAVSLRASLGVSYGGQLGSGVADHSIRANFSLKF